MVQTTPPLSLIEITFTKISRTVRSKLNNFLVIKVPGNPGEKGANRKQSEGMACALDKTESN